jgi:hypothetical protein
MAAMGVVPPSMNSKIARRALICVFEVATVEQFAFEVAKKLSHMAIGRLSEPELSAA